MSEVMHLKKSQGSAVRGSFQTAPAEHRHNPGVWGLRWMQVEVFEYEHIY